MIHPLLLMSPGFVRFPLSWNGKIVTANRAAE